MKSAFLFALFFPSLSLFAQQFEYPLHLKDLSFSGSNYLVIKKDNGSGSYSGPHWDESGRRYPVAYESGSPLQASAHITMACSSAADSVWVRASCLDSFEFEPKKCAVSGSPGDYSIFYSGGNTNQVFPANRIDYFDSLKINWEVSFDEGGSWRSAGSSNNPLYVTWQTPRSESAFAGYEWFESLFYLSCKNAKGQQSEDSIIARCWEEFTDNEITRVDGNPLNYYKQILESNSQTAELLADGQGQCYCFARLFMDLLKIQGISRTNNYLNISADNTPSSCGSVSRFLVKDWSFHSPADSLSCTDLPWRNVAGMDLYSGDTSYLFDYVEVSDELGVKGQHAPNPASLFNNHQIILIDGIYYDPSYGLRYNSIDDIRLIAISGWASRISSTEATEAVDVNGDSVLSAGVSVYRFRMTNDVLFANFDVSISSY